VTCDECLKALPALVDNEVGAEERALLETHLRACDSCARELRRQTRFATTVTKAVRTLAPPADFSSKVLARYEGTKAELAAAPAGRAARALPVWPFALGIAVLLLAGLLLLVLPRRPEALGTLREGREAARILYYHRDGSWREAQGRWELRNGDRVEILKPPGAPAALDLGLAGEVRLRAPCGVQVQREGAVLALRLLPEAPGRVRLRTLGASQPGLELRALRVGLGQAWVELACGEHNTVDVEPLPDGRLCASVRTGLARVGNLTDAQNVAEGFAGSAPQEGPCTPPVEAKPLTIE
jgi:hypothetical protein